MEHIVQFGITIDDDAIRRSIEDKALDALTKEILRQVSGNLPKLYGNNRVDWRRVAYGAIENWIIENKETIMDLAADRLVESVKRTKAWKEKYTVVLDG